MSYYFGDDQQSPAPIFIRQIAPHDIDLVAAAMSSIITKYHPDWTDNFLFTSTDRDRVIGFDNRAIIEFLQRYIIYSRTVHKSLSSTNWGDFADALQGSYGYTDDDIRDYLQSMLEVQAAGLMKDSIIQPWTYTATTIASDVKTNLGGALGAVGGAAAPFAVIAVALVVGYYILTRQTVRYQYQTR
jgi:hypothetical protein